VRFAQGIQALFEQAGCDEALELGPQAELIWLAQMSWRPEHKVLWTSSLAKGRNALDQMVTAAGQLHVQGASVDFAAMESGRGARKKVAVPVYPFQHERFWPGPMGSDDPSTLKDCFFELRWASQGKIPGPHAGRRGQSWLVLTDEPELGAALAEALRGDGQGRVSAQNLSRDDASCAALATMLDETQGEAVLDHVVLVAGPVDIIEPDAMWNAQSHGVVRALLVAQSLLAGRRNTQLWLVTRGALAVRDGDVVDPTHAATWGFGRTFALEHPDRCGGLIDAAGSGPIAGLAHELAGALLCDDGEKQAAVRAGERWLLRLERYVMPAPVSPVSISAQAAYLITGGTGALGLAVARHLAQRGAGQIVLTSRSGGNRATEDAMREIGARGCRVDMIRADLRP
jgi:acyl transferase domain-containing protein